MSRGRESGSARELLARRARAGRARPDVVIVGRRACVAGQLFGGAHVRDSLSSQSA